jgi:hypothetical protein
MDRHTDRPSMPTRVVLGCLSNSEKFPRLQSTGEVAALNL